MPSPEEEMQQRLGRMEAELKWLQHNQAGLDARLARVEDSMVFRTLRAIGRIYQTRIARRKAGASRGYAEWVSRAGMDAAPAMALRVQPLITVRVTVKRPVRERLERAVKSVQAQTYGRWELSCDIDPAAPSWAKEILSGAQPEGGEWIAHLGENDFLSPTALEHFAAALQDGAPDLVYSDADIVDAAGLPLRPVFKPDWSPILLRHVPYLGGLRMERAGLTGEPGGVVHIPRVLYHCGETAGLPANAAATATTTFRPSVSIVICTRTSALLGRCLAGLRDRTDYAAKEAIVVQHLGTTGAGEERAVASTIEKFGAKRVAFSEAFNFSEMNNRGSRAASGEILLFLNDDVEPIATDWLARMVSHLEDPAVGAAGAKLMYASGAIQHAGIATWLIDGAGHPGRNLMTSDNWPWLNYTREVSAVTGACLAMRRADFETLGGFDPVFPVNYNDVDLCLRLRAAGFSIVFDAQAVLRHDESQTRRPGTQYDERRLFYRRWAHVVEKVDPYYSPHLAQNNEDLSLR
jgi:hypothetical protein